MHPRESLLPLPRITCIRSVLAIVAGLLLALQVLGPAPAQSAGAASDAGPVPLCFGDCNRDGEVTIDEITQIVNLILRGPSTGTCSDVYLFPGRDIRAVILAVSATLRGCQAFTYRLGPGSSIVDSFATAGEEPLSGTFTAVPAVTGDPNTLFSFTIPQVDLDSPTTSVSGHGFIDTFTLEQTVTTAICAVIGGEDFELCGYSPFSVVTGNCPPDAPLCEYPPRFEGLEMCAVAAGDPAPCEPSTCQAIRDGTRNGYSVTLFAVPEEQHRKSANGAMNVY